MRAGGRDSSPRESGRARSCASTTESPTPTALRSVRRSLAANSEVRELHVDGKTLSLDGDDERAATYKLLHARLKRLPADARQSQLEVILHDLPEREEGDFGRPLTADELRAFAATPGLAVGAHTVSHPS